MGLSDLRHNWAKLVTGSEKCPACGQTNPNDYVLGSAGCDTCGGTLPYKARPSKKHPGAIEVHFHDGERGVWDIPHWVTSKNPDDAARARTHGFVQQKEDGSWHAGHYAPYRPDVLAQGSGKSAQGAVDATFQDMADKVGAKWWKRK